jgi:hypothetical protein
MTGGLIAAIFILEATLLKTIHVSCVVLSYALFFLRGKLMLCNTQLAQARKVGVVLDAAECPEIRRRRPLP